MSRRTASLALCLVLPLAACGGGGDDETAQASGSPSPSATSASPSPSPSLDPKAAGAAAAAAINLKAADLPAGFTPTPADETAADEDASDAQLATCVGIPDTQPVTEVPSDDFTKGQDLPTLTYSSSVEVFADPTVVRTELAAFQGDELGPCLSKLFAKEIASGADGVTFSKPVVTRLTPAATGTDGAFGVKVTTTGKADGQSIPFTFEVLGYAKGRTEVTLTVLAAGTRTVDAERDALFATLVDRAGSAV